MRKVDVMEFEGRKGEWVVVVGKQADDSKVDVVVGQIVGQDEDTGFDVVKVEKVIKDSKYEEVELEEGDEIELQAGWLYGFVIECKDENEAMKVGNEYKNKSDEEIVKEIESVIR